MNENTLDALKADSQVFSRATDTRSELEKDFSRAIDVQSTLLPKRGLRVFAWETYYDYAPAGGLAEITAIWSPPTPTISSSSLVTLLVRELWVR